MSERQRGYSLVEALVSVALLGAIAAALAPPTYTAVRASIRLAEAANDSETDRVGEETLTQLFQRMSRLDRASSGYAFVGEPRFVSFALLKDGETGASAIDLKIMADELFLFDCRLLTAASKNLREENGRTPILLMQDVSRFRFYGPQGPDSEPAWSDRWREADPPLLVAIERSASRNAVPQPLRSYYLGSRAPVVCLFDQVIRQCR